MNYHFLYAASFLISKPIKNIEFIRKHSDEGDIVLDCFSGSGTTAIAAYNTNRSFVGCELDKYYYEKTLIRFSENNISAGEIKTLQYK